MKSTQINVFAAVPSKPKAILNIVFKNSERAHYVYMLYCVVGTLYVPHIG